MSSTNKSYNLDEALDYIEHGEGNTKVKGNQKLSLALNAVDLYAKDRGLDADVLKTLVRIITTVNHGSSVISKIIRLLVPASVVPSLCVVQLLSWMCTNKPSLTVQNLILRWILVIYDYIDRKESLHSLYGVLFYFMEWQILAANACHLLFLLTRKEDVKLFRVRQLLAFQEKMGLQPYLTGLLSTYKLYYPNLFSVPLPKKHKVFFRSIDKNWSLLVKQVHDKNNRLQQSQMFISNYLSREDQSFFSKTKRRKVELVPEVVSHATDCTKVIPSRTNRQFHSEKVPFVQIRKFKCILDNIDRIEFPSQISSALKNPLLQHVISYCGDRIVGARFNFWLHQVLWDEFLESDVKLTETNAEILELLYQFSKFLQESLPVVDRFLFCYLHSWNGDDYKEQILKLITRIGFYKFSDLHDQLLEPLRKLFVCSSLYFKCEVILVLNCLLRKYVTVEWSRYSRDDQNGENETVFHSIHLFADSLHVAETAGLNPIATIQQLVTFIEELSLLGLMLENDHILLQHCLFEFLEVISVLYCKHRLHTVCFPKTSLLPGILCSNNAIAVSRLCQILCNYKAEFTEFRKGTVTPPMDTANTEMLNRCNLLILDVCNALWRSNIPLDGLNTLTFDFRIDLDKSELASKLSLYHHQAFQGYARQFLLEEQDGNVDYHPQRLKDLRRKFLKFLSKENLNGVENFFNNFIKSLSRSSSSTADYSFPQDKH